MHALMPGPLVPPRQCALFLQSAGAMHVVRMRLPKRVRGCRVECCVRCLAQGVRATHIIDGRQEHSLLLELLTDEGVGTMLVG